MEPSNKLYNHNLELLINNDLKINDLAIKDGELVSIDTFMGKVVEWIKSSLSFGWREKEKQELILDTIKHVNQNIENYKKYVFTQHWSNEKISGIRQYDINDTLELMSQSVQNLVGNSEKRQETLDLIVKTHHSLVNLINKEKAKEKVQKEYLNFFRSLPAYSALIYAFNKKNLPKENSNADPMTEKFNQLKEDFTPIIDDLQELDHEEQLSEKEEWRFLGGPFHKEIRIKHDSDIKNKINSCCNFFIKNEKEINELKDFIVNQLKSKLNEKTIILNNNRKTEIIAQLTAKNAKVWDMWNDIDIIDLKVSDDIKNLYKELEKIGNEELDYEYTKKLIQDLNKSMTPEQENQFEQLKKKITSLS